MILPILVLILVAGGVLSAVSSRSERVPRIVAIVTLLACVPPAAGLFIVNRTEWRAEWIPALGISLHFAADGLSAILIALTLALGFAAVLSSWRSIRERIGFFHAALLWTLAGVVGVFSAQDLFLFFVFWEVMLVPMYFLIAIWGHERRLYAAMKFFLFTQASGLLLFAAIIACAWLAFKSSGRFSFDLADLVHANYGTAAPWLLLGFFIAFGVKLPVMVLHTWLPDAHTQASTGGSVILAGILLKTGAYGLIRFAVPLFPQAAQAFSPYAMALGAAGILYGALLAYGQRDIKRLVAYTSVSHMGFVLLGIFSFSSTAREGAVMQMVAHGFSTGALFVLVGALQDRLNTRDLAAMGGFWSTVPRLSAFALFFAIASLGLPGFANFIGEFLILLGSFARNPAATVFAALGLVFSAVYALYFVQRAFQGTAKEGAPRTDATPREVWLLGAMAVVLVVLGFVPQPLFDALAFATGVGAP